MSRSSSTPHDRSAQFGPNEWLVEEMYEQFLANPSTVDPAWHDFFGDYRPASRGTNGEAPTSQQQPQIRIHRAAARTPNEILL